MHLSHIPQYFVTEMSTCVHISGTKCCIVRHLPYAFWDLWDGFVMQTFCTFRVISLALAITHTLHIRHNGHDGVSNHQPFDGLLNRLFGSKSKKTSKLCVTGLCVANALVTDEFPHKGLVTRKMFPFDDVIMYDCSSASQAALKDMSEYIPWVLKNWYYISWDTLIIVSTNGMTWRCFSWKIIIKTPVLTIVCKCIGNILNHFVRGTVCWMWMLERQIINRDLPVKFTSLALR